MSEVQVCCDCKRISPPTQTNYTLISTEHGWRLARTKLPDGKIRLEWRCPKCWAKFVGRAPAK